jgi:hypothetical protein
MEMMAALMLFGLAGTALIVALSSMADLALESQMDVRMQMRVQSRLTEFHKMNNLQEWAGKTETSEKDEMGVWTETSVEELKDVYQNKQGQALQQLYKVHVIAFYDRNGTMQETHAEAVRYLPLYRTTGAGGFNQPQPTNPGGGR